MAGTLSSGKRRGPIVGINVTPMVDVVLVLLVIMMVSATYIVAQSLKVDLPKSQSSDEATPVVAQVTIKKDGHTLFGDAEVDERGLVDKLRAAHTSDPDVSLVLTADRATAHGDVVHVVDLAKREGISKFSINVESAQ